MAFKAGAIYGEAFLDTTRWTSGLTLMKKATVGTMAGITAIFVATMVKTSKATNEFAKELANVSTLVDTNEVNIKGISESLLKLNPELGNTTKLTKGMYQAFSSGAKTADAAMALTTQGAKFAVAGVTDIFTAVDVLSTAVNAYGKETVSAAKASDIFFKAIKEGKVTGEELAASIGTSIPLYASAGIKLEGLASGLSALTKKGVKANVATTQLNAIVSAFLKPSEEMIESLQQIGFESGSAFLKAEGLVGALEMLFTATQGDTAALAELLPNIRALRGALALTKDGGKEFNRILVEMEEATGATDAAFQKQEKTWDTAQNALHKVALEIGTVSKAFLDDLANTVTSAAMWFVNLEEGTKAFASTFVQVGAAVGVTTLAVTGLNAALALLAAHPLVAATTGVMLLTTTIITLTKRMQAKAISEAAGRFADIAKAVGITSEQVDELGAGMLALEKYFQNQKHTNPYATAERSLAGMINQIKEISKERGIEQEQLIDVALTSGKITAEQKKALEEYRLQVVSVKELAELNNGLVAAEEKLYGWAERVGVKRHLASAAAESAAIAAKKETDTLAEQEAILAKLETARKEQELKELARQARLEGVIESRQTATEAFANAQEQASIRLNLGITTTKENLLENITASKAFRDALIAIGYDGADATTVGNIALQDTLNLLEEQKTLLEDMGMLEMEQQTLTIMDKLKANWQNYFKFISEGMNELQSLGVKNTALHFENEKNMLELKSQEDLERLENDFNNKLITEEEYNLQKELIEAETLQKTNALAEKKFEADKKNQKASVWMNLANSIVGWWSVAPELGPIAGPIFAGVMTGLVSAASIKQLGLIDSQQFVPSMATGGVASGLTRVNEEGGEIFNLPGGTLVIPNDISSQIAQNAGNQNTINVSFEGATIANNMDLDKIVEKVSRKLGQQLRVA